MTAEIVRRPVTRFHLFAFHGGKMKCSRQGCRCREGLASTPIERSRDIVRFPISREDAVMVITNRATCEALNCPCHEAAKVYLELLHESIFRLVLDVMKKFPHLVNKDDLLQQCLHRIMKNLHKYDQNRGALFSTWAWKVSENVLKRESDKWYRENRVFTSLTPVHEAVIGRKDAPIFSTDVADAVATLKRGNPGMADVINVIFSGGARAANGNILMSKLARETRRDYGEVRTFMMRVVRPLFKEWFHYGEKQ